MEHTNDAEHKLLLNCWGGLGNQLFIYAAGRYFAKGLGRTIEVVKAHAAHQQSRGYKRPFQLDAFCIQERMRDTTVLDRFFFSGNWRLKRGHAVAGRLLNSEAIQEPSAFRFHPDLAVDAAKARIYMTGYWQAAGYAQEVEAELRSELTLRSPLQSRNREYAERIQSLDCPVSVHVRIGDYAQITHPTGTTDGQRVSNVLSPRYYERAIQTLRQAVSKFTLVVFSDDMAAAQELLRGVESCVYVEGNETASAHEDLWLMSLCRHHVIANSSFSWWGAWLNPHADKRVFSPRYWGNTVESYFPDLYPAGWTIVDNL